MSWTMWGIWRHCCGLYPASEPLTDEQPETLNMLYLEKSGIEFVGNQVVIGWGNTPTLPGQIGRGGVDGVRRGG
ncbi:MAG: hypothetical protein ACJAYU_004324 [Bradymonadia bacterium]|jgi:hypothetical protein